MSQNLRRYQWLNKYTKIRVITAVTNNIIKTLIFNTYTHTRLGVNAIIEKHTRYHDCTKYTSILSMYSMRIYN